MPQQIRVGDTIYTRRTQYYEWQRNQFRSINAAKRANGLNGTSAASGKDLPAQTATRRMQEQRKADRRITDPSEYVLAGNEERRQDARRKQQRRK